MHKHFGFHLRNSSMTSEMSLPQKVVNLLEVLRDYAPITNILALLVLPLGIHSRGLREIASPQHANSRQRSLQVLHYLLLASYVSNKICTAALYHEVGLSHVWNYQSNEVWAAPCKSLSLLPRRAWDRSNVFHSNPIKQGIVQLTFARMEIWLTAASYHSSLRL